MCVKKKVFSKTVYVKERKKEEFKSTRFWSVENSMEPLKEREWVDEGYHLLVDATTTTFVPDDDVALESISMISWDDIRISCCLLCFETKKEKLWFLRGNQETKSWNFCGTQEA